MGLNNEPGWSCQECKSPLKVYAEPWIDPDSGEEFPGAIELCESCVQDARSHGYSDGADDGYDDGYADGERAYAPDPRLLVLVQRLVDAIEDGQEPDPWEFSELKELL